MKIGFIGGSGLYHIGSLQNVRELKISTPFGNPSDAIVSGELGPAELFFLPRHGRRHSLAPGEINHRANIHAMKSLGISHVFSISAVGSLREEMRPRDIVIVDQFFDRCRRTPEHSFFGNGAVAHVAMADPVCNELAAFAFEITSEAAANVTNADGSPIRVFPKGTYVNMEGPAFSTRAESLIYQSWGLDVIGMTNMAEARLAREAEIAYCSIAMVTDYDCWHQTHESVSVDMVVANLNANAELARDIIARIAANSARIKSDCPCHHSLASALITPGDAIPPETRARLNAIIGKYLRY